MASLSQATTAPKTTELSRHNFGAPHTLPTLTFLNQRNPRQPNVIRQRILLQTLERIEQDGTRCHALAEANVRRWFAERQATSTPPSSSCEVRVLPGDWGQVVLDLTREYGKCFAALNMANAYGPGGGYAQGMVAQEENMFRRLQNSFGGFLYKLCVCIFCIC